MAFIKLKNFIQTTISIVAAFLLVFLIVQADWTAPTQTPPACDLSNPACNTPINVGASSQYKSGALGIEGILRGYSNAFFDGNVGIGTTDTAGYKLNIVGNAGAIAVVWNTLSDIRLKTNIIPLESSLNKVLSLQGVSFEFKSAPGEKQIGFIAQEVEKALPELVSTGSDGIKSLSYDRLTAVLVEAIKELKAENDSLKAQIEKLEGSM